jgi:hypothetical protein
LLSNLVITTPLKEDLLEGLFFRLEMSLLSYQLVLIADSEDGFQNVVHHLMIHELVRVVSELTVVARHPRETHSVGLHAQRRLVRLNPL